MKNLFLIVFIFTAISINSGYSQPPKIALHFSETTQLLDDQLIDKLTYWELFLINNNVGYDVIYDRDIESGVDSKKYPLILFFSTIALNEKSFNEIVRYTENGGSLITIGEFITRDEKLITTGWKRFESIFGIRFEGRIPKNKMSTMVDFAFYSPLSNNVKKLTDIRVSTKNSPIVVEPLFGNCKSIAMFKDNKEFSNINTAAGVVNSSNNSYRIWYAFDPSEIVGEKEDLYAFKQIILNSITWLRGDNIAWIDSRFDDNSAPTLILFDLTVDTKQSDEILKVVKRFEFYPGFIIPVSDNNIEEIKLLTQKGDIIPYLNMQTITLDKSLSKQELIEKQFIAFKRITGKSIQSVFFNSDNLSDEVIEILKKNKIKNLFISSPVSFAQLNDGINIINLTGRNNLKFREIQKDNKKYSLEKFYLDNLSRLKFSNKIPVVVYKTFPDCSDSEFLQFEKFLGLLKQSGGRIISVDDYHQLIELNKALQISIKQPESGIIELYLENKSNINIENVAVNISSGQIRNRNSVSIISERKKVDSFVEKNRSSVKILLDKISRNSTLKIDVSLK